jgi:tripartite-type tricarboxylate transporter receptor subunit TctC
MKSRNISLICGAMLMLPAADAVLAQAAYPVKPVRWVVGYAPGGGTDLLARMVGQKFSEAWGQPVLVDNRAGGATNIGTEFAAKSAPDGYTLFSPTVANAINVTLFPKLNYDIMRDFAHITNLAKIPNILVVNPSVPVQNVKELIALAKERPDQLRYASPGIGSPQHLGGEIFKYITDVKMLHIPYKGAAPAIADTMAGHVDVYLGAMNSTLPQVRSGRLRILGITTLKRSEAAPDVPTLNEQGLNGFETASWVMLSAPAGTPRDIITKIHGEAVRTLGMRDIRERFLKDGADPVGDTPEQVTAYLKAEIEKWGRAVRSSGAKPEG